MNMPNTDPETGIRYGVIPLRDLDHHFAYEEFYNNSENLAMKEIKLELDEMFDPITEFIREHGLDKETEIRGLKGSIMEELFENWDESEDSRLYDHSGYRMQLIGNDLFIAKSPYVTSGPQCSPCAPGAVYIADADGKNGLLAYCLPDEFFEGGKAPYKYFTIKEGYDKTWKKLFPRKAPKLIDDMNDLMSFIDKREAEEKNLDALHWIRQLKRNVILLIESENANPHSNRSKFYLMSVRTQIGMVNAIKEKEQSTMQDT